jgi:mannonate dehydratase
MKIAMAYFHNEHESKKAISKQLGVNYVVTNVDVPASNLPAGMKQWDYVPLLHKIKSFEDDGLKVVVIEGPPPMNKIKLGLPGRDEEIAEFCKFIQNAGKLGIEVVCYNWMPIIGWFRTSTTKRTRGNALVTSFEYDLIKDAPLTEAGIVTQEELWENLEYFLKAVVPVAEKAKVKLAIHPDDPPVPSIKGISRILINADAFKRVIDMVPSDYNGITMCQGSFTTMGENVPELIRYFGKMNKLFFAHFRDIRGTAYKFEETFHDDGQQDMFEAIKCYKEIGYDGIMRPDHVPTMDGEDNNNPSYGILGNLFAIGYMKGLMEAVEKTYSK